MTWNYRIFRKKIVYSERMAKLPDLPEYYYEIREVFYNQNHEITAHTTEAVDLGAESIDELEKVCRAILFDIERSKHEVLEENEIIYASDDPPDPEFDS